MHNIHHQLVYSCPLLRWLKAAHWQAVARLLLFFEKSFPRGLGVGGRTVWCHAAQVRQDGCHSV